MTPERTTHKILQVSSPQKEVPSPDDVDLIIDDLGSSHKKESDESDSGVSERLIARKNKKD